MKIYRLIPVNLQSTDWRASTWTEEAIVRAASARQARQVATAAFGIAVKRSHEHGTVLNPWSQEALVRVIENQGAEFSADGPVALLRPTEYNDAISDLIWTDI